MADSYVSSKHDFAIRDTTSTDLVGLVLVRDKNGAPVWQEADDEYLANQMFTNAPDYSYLPPSKELALRQSDWRGGFGQETFSDYEPERYFSSKNCDARFKGMVICGPKATGIALPASITTAATLTNAGFESGTAGWTNLTAYTTYVRSGTSCAGVGAGATAYQNAATWDTSWQGATFNAGGWAAHVGSKIGITDGAGTTLSNAKSVAGTTMEYLTVSRTLAASATMCRVQLVAASALASYYDDIYIGSPIVGVPSAFAEFNDKLYVGIGGQLMELHSGGTSLTHVWSFPASITDIEPFTDNNLYIACGTASNYWWADTAGVLTEADTVTINKFQFFKTVHTATPTMYGNDGINTIRSATAPASSGAVWSGTATTVGSSYYNITNLVSFSGALYIMKEDMPYYLDSAGAVQNDLAPELSTITDSSKGKNAMLWLNRLYMPAGASLLEYDVGVNTWRSPAEYCTNLGTFDGDVQALAADEQWLFAILGNSPKVEVVACREETIVGTTGWVVHPISEITMGGCEVAFVSSVVRKNLWIASASTADSLYHIPLYASYGDVTNDDNRNFQTGGTFETPWLHGNFPASSKGFIKLTLTMEDTAASTYVGVEYMKKADTAWVTLGDFKTEPTTTVYFANTAVSSVTSNFIKFQYTFNTASTALTPKLLDYDCRAILYPDQRKIITCQVRCADQLTLKDGTVEQSNYTTIKNAIDRIRSATYPVECRDIDGNTIYCRALPMSPVWTLTADEKGRQNKERVYNLALQIVDLA